jgi:8-oxo-dGTP pyrophosphatase MutT (NUDIX family)
MVEIAHILLMLPDGRVVLQRRDDKAPLAPNKLALFGGHIEPGESPDLAMRRELGEETSLDVASLDIQPVYEYEFELTSWDGTVSHFHTYRADIPNADFEVYEGSGAEVYPVSEALARDDIVPSVKHALTKLGG